MGCKEKTGWGEVGRGGKQAGNENRMTDGSQGGESWVLFIRLVLREAVRLRACWEAHEGEIIDSLTNISFALSVV